MPSSCHAQVSTAMHSSYHLQSLPRTHPPLLSDAHLAASARHPNIACLALAREVLLEVNGCQKCSRHHLMNPRTIFSHSFEVELAKINSRLLSKAVCMRHGDKHVIKVRVLEATQTAEPILRILPLSPCVSKHSENHLALKDPPAFPALRRPVLRSRIFHLRLS